MSDVYVVVEIDEGEGDLEHIRGVFTESRLAESAAEEMRADWAGTGLGAKVAVQVWEANKLYGHRTKTSYALINDAPHRSNRQWNVREYMLVDAELGDPDESVVWCKIGPFGGQRDQVQVYAPTIERATEMMREAMESYTPEAHS